MQKIYFERELIIAYSEEDEAVLVFKVVFTYLGIKEKGKCY